jgi:hypothetical protein
VASFPGPGAAKTQFRFGLRPQALESKEDDNPPARSASDLSKAKGTGSRQSKDKSNSNSQDASVTLLAASVPLRSKQVVSTSSESHCQSNSGNQPLYQNQGKPAASSSHFSIIQIQLTIPLFCHGNSATQFIQKQKPRHRESQLEDPQLQDDLSDVPSPKKRRHYRQPIGKLSLCCCR